jgi:hypothetical protein
MHLTLIHPCIGHRAGKPYIRTWQMEPLPPATIAGLTPKEVPISFYDDRMELIPYDSPTDLVAISVETYTAKRAYQIASEYRRRGVPIVMGGFHATLCPQEVAQYAEAVVIGEAENLWEQVLMDAEKSSLQTYTIRRIVATTTGRRSLDLRGATYRADRSRRAATSAVTSVRCRPFFNIRKLAVPSMIFWQSWRRCVTVQ